MRGVGSEIARTGGDVKAQRGVAWGIRGTREDGGLRTTRASGAIDADGADKAALRMRIATGRIVDGAVVTRARFPEGARGRIILEDERPPVDLDPDEEAGMLKGLQEISEGKGRPVSRLRAKLRRHFR